MLVHHVVYGMNVTLPLEYTKLMNKIIIPLVLTVRH